jgi:peptidoglycan/LPS O-acetylase OafA/YrhL
MLLGVVLHSAITYGTFNYGEAWSLKDVNSTNLTYDLIVWFIHVFRMPIFFAITGFFGALLFYERSPQKMIKNRLQRVVSPFILFLFVLWPFIVFAWVFTGAVISGDEAALSTTFEVMINPLVYIPQNTFHLWFLNYLIYFVAFSWVFAILMKKLVNLSRIVKNVFEFFFRYIIITPLIFASFTFLLFYLLDVEDIDNNIFFIPDWKSWLLYLQFYIWGWLLFKSKELLSKLNSFDHLFLTVAIGAFVLNAIFYDSTSHIQHMVINALMKWMFLFGIMGMFIRFFSSSNSKMRYLSDSSYWIYLIHLPLTAFIPGLMINLNMPTHIKFFIVLITTSIFCLLTYHYLVRSTFIGKFLNGKK